MVMLRLQGDRGPVGSGQLPMHERIAASVRRAIADGQLAPGDALPTAREVATAFDVHQNTVLRAYRALRDEGTIDLRAGRGAQVRRDLPASHLVAAQVDELARAASHAGLDVEGVVGLVREALERLYGGGGARAGDASRTGVPAAAGRTRGSGRSGPR